MALAILLLPRPERGTRATAASPKDAMNTQFELVRADDTVTHVALSGRLDVDGVQAVSDKFVFATAPRGTATLVDLSQVAFLASLGISMLLTVAHALRPRGAKMVLCAPNQMVHKTLTAAGIHQLMPIVATVDEGMQQLR